MTTKPTTILAYQFEDAQRNILATGIGHFIMATLFVILDFSKILTDPRAQVCILIFVFLLSLFFVYDWKSSTSNWIISSIYLLLIIIELSIWGIPQRLIEYDNNPMSRGALFEMFLALIPYVYIGLRLLLIVPLIKISVLSQRVNALSKTA